MKILNNIKSLFSKKEINNTPSALDYISPWDDYIHIITKINKRLCRLGSAVLILGTTDYLKIVAKHYNEVTSSEVKIVGSDKFTLYLSGCPLAQEKEVYGIMMYYLPAGVGVKFISEI